MTKPKEKILIIKLGALGDFIQSLGPIAAIKRHHPNAHITLLTTKPFEKFAKECGLLDNIWLDNKPKLWDVPGWLRLRSKLIGAKFSRVYDLQNNDRTAFYFKILHPKPEWVGAVKGASHSNTSPERTKGHAFDGHVQTLKLAGINDIEVDKLEWMKDDISTFDLKNNYALLIPGCAPSRPEKRWPADHYAALAKSLLEIGIQPVIIGTNDEKQAAELIMEAAPDTLNLINKTNLNQITTLARNAKIAIGNDTGPMHIIGATGCPSVVLFSNASNPIKHAPKGTQVHIMQNDDLEYLYPHEVFRKCQLILSEEN